jgi:hypothetical protein
LPSTTETAVEPTAAPVDKTQPTKVAAEKLLTKLDQTKGELRLFQIGDTVLITEDVNESTDTKYVRFTRVGAVTGGKIAWRKELELPHYAHGIKDIEGTYPDGLLLTYVFDHGRSADQVTHASSKAGWVAKRKQSSYYDFYFETTTVPGGSILGTTMRDVQAGRLTSVAGLAKAPVIPKSERCGAEGAFISTLSATSTGTLVGLGSCAGQHVAAVWAPEQTEGKLHFFEKPTSQSGGSVLFSGRGDSAWAWIDDSVAHYVDGKWAPLEQGPLAQSGSDYARGPGGGVELENGEVWMHSSSPGLLFRRTAAGAYGVVELPSGVGVSGVGLQDGKVLVAASNLLLGQGSGGVDWTQVNLDEKREKRVIGAQPASPACKTNVVVLYGFTKVTPDDYDFPLTRKALKGQKSFSDVTFAVTREAGRSSSWG